MRKVERKMFEILNEAIEKEPVSNMTDVPKERQYSISRRLSNLPSRPDLEEDNYEKEQDETDESPDQDYGLEDGEASYPEPPDSSDIINLFILKKIYFKLISIRNILDYFSYKEIEDTKQKILEAISIFELVINNYSLFKPKIKDIIKKYNSFMVSVVNYVEKMSKEKK